MTYKYSSPHLDALQPYSLRAQALHDVSRFTDLYPCTMAQIPTLQRILASQHLWKHEGLHDVSLHQFACLLSLKLDPVIKDANRSNKLQLVHGTPMEKMQAQHQTMTSHPWHSAFLLLVQTLHQLHFHLPGAGGFAVCSKWKHVKPPSSFARRRRGFWACACVR